MLVHLCVPSTPPSTPKNDHYFLPTGQKKQPVTPHGRSNRYPLVSKERHS